MAVKKTSAAKPAAKTAKEVKPVKTVKADPKAAEKPMKISKKADLSQFLSEIEKRAYEIYLERHAAGTPGDEMYDWLQAEMEIKARYRI